MSYDFNDAESNSNSYELIPSGTVAPMIMTIRPGAVGDGGWETASKTSDATYLSCEYAITDGPYKGRRFWGNLVVSGGKKNADGSSIAGNISRSTLRGILESARKIKPDDASDAAINGRKVNGYGDFSGIEFVGQVGIEKGTGGYEDKNKLATAIPCNSAKYDWQKWADAPTAQTAAPDTASNNAAPAWAS